MFASYNDPIFIQYLTFFYLIFYVYASILLCSIPLRLLCFAFLLKTKFYFFRFICLMKVILMVFSWKMGRGLVELLTGWVQRVNLRKRSVLSCFFFTAIIFFSMRFRDFRLLKHLNWALRAFKLSLKSSQIDLLSFQVELFKAFKFRFKSFQIEL